MKIAANGTVNYLTYFGDTTRDSLVDLTLQGGSVYLLGNSCSVEPPVTCGRTFIAQIAADGTTVQRAVRVDGLNSYAFGVDVRSRAYVIGYAEPPLATTPDAFQSSADFIGSPMLVVLTLDSASPAVQYASYLGGGGPLPHTVRIDGAGGIVYGGQFNHNDGHLGTPIVNAPFASTAPGGVVIHVVPESRMVDNVGREIVIYAADVATMRGNWRLEEDASAALGRKLRNPNAGAAKLSTPLAAPADYVEFQFHAESGVGYHLWMRGRADSDNWANDSVFVQFSDSVDASGAATARIGSTGAMSVNLEDCTNCGVRGWGWQDNGYGATRSCCRPVAMSRRRPAR